MELSCAPCHASSQFHGPAPRSPLRRLSVRRDSRVSILTRFLCELTFPCRSDIGLRSRRSRHQSHIVIYILYGARAMRGAAALGYTVQVLWLSAGTHSTLTRSREGTPVEWRALHFTQRKLHEIGRRVSRRTRGSRSPIHLCALPHSTSHSGFVKFLPVLYALRHVASIPP